MQSRIKSLVRPFKPWVIPGPSWKALVSDTLNRESILSQISTELDVALAIAKPSENLYLGQPVAGLSAAAAAVVNVASHGEMAIQSVFPGDLEDTQLIKLIDILPTKVELGIRDPTKIGKKSGKLLNHFGYRKQVMNLVPETLDDHAWIACALSYRVCESPSMPNFMFDPKGGCIAGGVAAVTNEGAIFRGSGITDAMESLVTPRQSLEVSLAANGVSFESIMDMAECPDEDRFVQHKFYGKLVDLLRKAS